LIFIDTGAILARHLQRDQHHRRALPIWAEFAASHERCLTSNFVLDECITLLARRAGYRFAGEVARSLYKSSVLEVLRPELDDELAALVLFEKYADQEVSFTDCVSFSLMRSHRIKRVFCFDRHFADAGFEVIR
jgi:uncharacterized protein